MAEAHASRSRTVLVVDDDADILETITMYLQVTFPGLQVVAARSGQEASQALVQGRFDLILCDYKMPGKNGLEVLAEAALRLPHAPRILVTAYPELGVALSALHEVQVRHFLVKPLDAEQLGAVVAEVLGVDMANMAGKLLPP